MISRKSILLSCVCAATAWSSVAYAQAQAAPSAANEIEELVVTAEKREQSLQDVPVAVSAFTDERRELVGINSVQDLTNFTPGLSYSTNNDRIALRGIGRFSNNRSSEGGVAMYNDGFYTSSVTAFAQSTLFLERTEALRGPQGTLYGKNAIGGALNIVSKRPTDDLYAEQRFGYGNYDSKTIEGAVSGPLLFGTRGRLAYSWSNIGKGEFHNLNPNGKDEGNRGTFWTVEGQLDGKLADDKFEWWLKASTTEWHTWAAGRAAHDRHLRPARQHHPAHRHPDAERGELRALNQQPGNTCQFCFDTDDGNYINLESSTYTVEATLHLDTFDVKYIAGMTYYDYRLQTDLDGTSRQAPFFLAVQARNPITTAPIPGQTTNVLYYPRQHNQYEEEVWWFSNELNFTSTGDGPVQWLLGLYQFREGSNYTLSDARFPDDARFERPTTQTGVSVAPNLDRRYALGTSENVSESYATFGQLDWQATETLKVTAGLRYTYDRKRSFEGARLLCLYTASCPISTPDPPAGGRHRRSPALGGAGPTRRSSVPAFTDPTTGIRHRR
jgi:iron complex outermembrane receptor protein